MATKERIREMPLEQVMGERFGRYSKYIIQERALPDIRDGLKPVQRRILYAMYQDGNTYDKPFKKAAKAVGNIMGNFHPHGDSSIYGALVHLSQDWKMREPLVEMHGNNGSMDGDGPAAMRYTESRLSKISNMLLQDIDKDTVNMVLNFDDTEYEPTVLPARFPNLLVNGSTGISAGYATEIPPHNLGEVIDATIYLLKHPDATLEDLMKYVKGPDFPTGAIIMGTKGIKEAYKTGRGRIQVRAKTSIQDIRGHRQEIVATEIPFDVNKSLLVKKIDEIRLNKEIDGIAEVRDETDRHGLSIVIELKKDTDAQNILNYLFKNTDLQVSYNFNMVAIDHMTPVQVGLKHILISYLEHEVDVVTKRTKFDLNKAEARLEIIQGLIHAMDILDQVIKTIRASKNKADAKKNLIAKYKFTEKQAEAIVSLQLYRLTNTDVNELIAEQDKLNKLAEKYRKLLSDRKTLEKEIIKELSAVKKEFSNPRRTQISQESAKVEIDEKALVADEQVRVLISRDGYLKRSSIRSYQSTDDADNGLPDGDKVVYENTLSILSNLYLFTNRGNVIYRPVHELVEVKWKETGQHLSQEIGLDNDEKIIRVFVLDKLSANINFLLVTNDGYIKQLELANLQPTRTYKSRAMTAIKLKNKDSLLVGVDAVKPDAKKEITLFTHRAYAIRYDISEIPTSGSKAVGVKSANLKEDDYIVNYVLVDNKYVDLMHVGLITQRGAFKQFKLKLVNKVSRAKRGVLVLRELKTKPHRIAALVPYAQDHVLHITTTSDRHVKIQTNEYPLGDRYSNGSFVIDTTTDGIPTSIELGRPISSQD
ncbi:DNA topoisomerase IV subunit A [Lactobacillus amylovorus]|jgi:topoisomerase-4 subunit A|uniref:DNA topoisomerase IV subunit A n=1 Tax=Lactobacillus amylovorus TaxID=1604 RepID=UPI0006F0BBD0|nr:DNA topoisomerase IV subunit A [Lactobacillus amylovorus]ATO52278.1 DNA topoisomerase IV subunit A [Lactobacillus amylovorus DSM 20531]KRK43308.1 DNA topoisomerase IV subunit A [Lactobacillus amylovorus DSM 20531]MCT3585558.1 DNA topoisomerase IV subunit A [Lactobacillus amylovorus]MCT3592091.1 DNA topoisomerase IV subunit A [Lactobacillus amylovorus]MDB6221976.1 DNA topoisomerase IV subunit A [Lactobacillus amylovorus]